MKRNGRHLQAVSSPVAPTLRGGRGLKRDSPGLHDTLRFVAPTLRGGRGLKLLVKVFNLVAVFVAPTLRGGRGLKPAKREFSFLTNRHSRRSKRESSVFCFPSLSLDTSIRCGNENLVGFLRAGNMMSRSWHWPACWIVKGLLVSVGLLGIEILRYALRGSGQAQNDSGCLNDRDCLFPCPMRHRRVRFPARGRG